MKRGRVQIFFDKDSSLTQQHFRDETDVNNIMSKYTADQLLEHRALYNGQYGDYTDIPDYQTALDKVIQADEMFATLPAKVRNRFQNDPALFLDFVDNPSNKDEMRSLGLLNDAPVSSPSVSEDGKVT